MAPFNVNTNFNNTYLAPNFNWNYGWTTASSVSDADKYKNEILQKQKKEKENELQYQENLELSKEKNNAINSLQAQLLEYEKNIKELEKSKNDDGSATVRVQKKDLGFWGNIGKGLSNVATAAINIGKSIIGFDESGQWQPTNALRNLAIAAIGVAVCACPALIPAAIPLVGGLSVGAVATGVGATVGVVSGVAGAIKGSVNLANANTEKEIDNAQQDIATGAIIGALSAFGLKGLRNTGAMTSNATTTSGASMNYVDVAKTQTTKLGKLWESISNYGRDVYRGMQKITNDDKALLQAQTGKFKTSKAMIAKAKNSIKNLDWQRQYEAKLTEIETKLNTRINRLNDKIANETNCTIIQNLENERTLLQNNLNELINIKGLKTKTLFDDVLKDTTTPRDKIFAKDLKTLVKYKENAMRTLAGKPDKNATLLEEYIPTSELKQSPIKWYNPTTWTKYTRANNYQYTIGGKNPGQFFKYTGKTLTTPTLSSNRILAQWEAPYSAPILFSQELSKEEFEKSMQELDAQKKQIETQLEQLKKMDINTLKQHLKTQKTT